MASLAVRWMKEAFIVLRGARRPRGLPAASASPPPQATKKSLDSWTVTDCNGSRPAACISSNQVEVACGTSEGRGRILAPTRTRATRATASRVGQRRGMQPQSQEPSAQKAHVSIMVTLGRGLFTDICSLTSAHCETLWTPCHALDAAALLRCNSHNEV